MNTTGYALTKDSVVETLRTIFAEALKVEANEVDVQLPLLEMGASSLVLVDALRAIQETYGVRPSTRKVFEHYTTLDLMAGYIVELVESRKKRATKRSTGAEGVPLEATAAAEEARKIPLTAAQQQLWFLANFSESASLAYHERLLVQLSGPLAVDALEAALRDVVNRHEVLRARLRFEESVQEIPADSDFTLQVVDLSAHEAVNREVAAWLTDDGRRSFALDRALFRATALRLREDSHLLVITAHALIVDQRALNRLVSEAFALYSARVSDTSAELEEPMSFAAYAAALDAQAQTPEALSSREYWLEQYRDGIPRVDLPADRPRPPAQSYKGSRLVVPLEGRLVRALTRASLLRDADLFTTLLTAYGALVHRLTGEPDLAIGVFGVDRDPESAGTGPLLANTTNPLALRIRVDGNAGFHEQLAATGRTLRAAEAHRDYPFASLVKSLNPERDQSRSPVFVVAFGAEQRREPPLVDGLRATFVTAPIEHTRYDLHVTLASSGHAAELVCDYSTDLFDAPTIRRFMGHYRTLLEAIAEAPETPIRALPLLSDDDLAQILDGWNDTRADYPRDRCVHHLVQAAAARASGDVAVAFERDGEGTLPNQSERQEITYRELDERSNQLARYLRKRGVEHGALVGVSVEPSIDMIVCLLAVLKAGGAYVPLDPAYPRDRIAFMISDAKLSVLLTQSHLAGGLPEHGADLVRVDGDWPAISAESSAAFDGGAGPESVAYVIYTSGSTGKPKGVAVPHRAVVNFLWTMKERPGIRATDRLLAVTSLSFDIAGLELFLPLVTGARVELVPREVAADGPRLRRRLEQSRISIMQATPATWQLLVDAGWEGGSDFRVLVGGEALPRELADKLLSRADVVWNMYGPTETTIWSCIHRVDGTGGPVPIGRPIANTTAFILDRHLAPTPIGVPGELHLGGDGLSHGYLDRPELTRERFVESPFGGPRAARSPRLYKTGDLCRYRADGTIEFLGRLDHQVKIRGFRIELGEIEAVLSAHPSMREVVVVAAKEKLGSERLVAYFVPAGDAPTSNELRAALRKQLPEHMIPSIFVPLPALPRTPNGKVDRKALPAPTSSVREALGHAYVAPRYEIEEYLAALWADLLGASRVGIHDDFFELGGHSLLIAALIVQVRRKYKVGLSLRDFFATPTIAQFAAWIARKQAERISHVDGGLHGGDDRVARERFEVLAREAALDPAIGPGDLVYEPVATPRTVLLTGATGFIGSYLLRELLDQTDMTIYCLVRASTEAEGRRRIHGSLKTWDVWKDGCDDRIVPVLGDLAKPRMGLDDEAWQALGRRVDLILHSAAMVKFLYPFQTLKPVNVGGTQEVIRLAFEGKIKPVHYISTAAVFPMGRHRVFREDTPIEQNVFLNLAYDETKWVSEKMLTQAAARGLPVALYRMGEVCGDSRTGRSVIDHAIFAFIKGCIQLKTFPEVGTRLDMAPVDYVAQSVVRIAMQPDSAGKAYHISNPEPLPVSDVNAWFRRKGYTFDMVSFDAWRDRVLGDERLTDNALYPFIGLLEDFSVVNTEFPTYDCTNTLRALEGTGVRCHPVNDQLLDTVFGFLTDVGFFPRPEAA